jgi:rRNA processing protein Krr1/Pno1
MANAPPPLLCEVITIDLKHLGAVIGTKGSTRLALEKKYATAISVPRSERSSSGTTEVTISGPCSDGIKGTIIAVKQLCEKGYAVALAGDDFTEGAVQMHPSFVSEIVGKNGFCARAIQDSLGVRLAIPHGGSIKNSNSLNGGTDASEHVRVGVAGAKDKVKMAKECIKELMKYHHSELTHPGVKHVEVEGIPDMAHSHIIGKKGAEILRIQTTFNVRVYMPQEHSVTKNVVVVGTDGEALDKAASEIKAVSEKAEENARERVERSNNNNKPKEDKSSSKPAAAAAVSEEEEEATAAATAVGVAEEELEKEGEEEGGDVKAVDVSMEEGEISEEG